MSEKFPSRLGARQNEARITLNQRQSQPIAQRQPHALVDPQDLLRFGQEISEWERIRAREPKEGNQGFRLSSLEHLAPRHDAPAATDTATANQEAHMAEVTPLFRHKGRKGNG